LKFYVRDWTGDQQLRLVSLSARGLWIECICIMHTAKRYGFLETSMGVMLDDDTLARLIGASIDDLYRLKSELLNAGIPSVEDVTGIWFSRRMIKEFAKSEKCAEAGKKGGGNPSLASHPNTVAKRDIQIPDTRNHISLKVTSKGDLYRSIVLPFESESFKQAWQDFIDHRKAKKAKMTEKAVKLIFKDLPKNEADAIASIEQSIKNGWTAIFPLKKETASSFSQSKPSLHHTQPNYLASKGVQQ